MASLGGAEWSVDTWLVRTTFSNSCRTMTRQLDTHTRTHIYAHAHTNIERKGGGRECGTQHLHLCPSYCIIWNHTVIKSLSCSLKPTIYIHTCTYTLRASYTLHGNTTHSRMTQHPGTQMLLNVELHAAPQNSPTEQPHTACSHMLAGCF